MKRSSIIILQIIVVLIGVLALVFMLVEPTREGRNVNATLYQVYFNDPFLIWAYTASIAFFIGLYQSIKILGNIGKNIIFSESSVNALKIIKYCGEIIVGFVVLAEGYLFIAQPGDDIAGGVFMGLLFILGSGVVSIAASVFEKTLQKAVDLKSKNDLIV